MASTQDIRDLLAQLAQSTIATQTQIDALAAEVRGLAANVGAIPGAAPSVFLQPARKPYERFNPLHIDKLVEKRRLAMQQRDDDALTTNDAIRAWRRRLAG